MLRLSRLTDRIESMSWLDKPSAMLNKLWDPVFGPNGPRLLQDAAYGTWLGHPLHPPVTDLPIGFWTSSMAFDLLKMEKAADITLKLGTVSSLAAAATGAAQWKDLQNVEGPRRLGVLHAMLNLGASGAYAASWVLRDRGNRDAGFLTALAGMGLATFSANLGGDLTFKLGTGVSRIAFEAPTREWTPVGQFDQFEDGKPQRVTVAETPVMLLRQGSNVLATSAVCPHLGGPLEQGEIADGSVTCPWHGSVFDLRDGHMLHGPATAPLHTYETRLHNGQVEVRHVPV